MYEELRKLVAVKMAQEAAGQTLQPTALLREAWLRLTGAAGQGWNSRGHFLFLPRSGPPFFRLQSSLAGKTSEPMPSPTRSGFFG